MKVGLSIAGSDSSGGAGIQADVRAIASCGVHPCTVVTCVTSQNTSGVISIHPLPLEEVENQISSLLNDVEIHAAKTGMLYSSEIANLVAEMIGDSHYPLVVDPVIQATTHAELSAENLIDSLREKLLPICKLVTPNINEAEALAGMEVRSIQDVEVACERIHDLGAENVLIKGGHLEGEPIDVLYSRGRLVRFSGPRVHQEVHGSGCAFSAFITACLALGVDLIESVKRAKKMITYGFFGSYKIGKGVRIIQSNYIEDKYSVYKELDVALDDLKLLLKADLIPEVGINFGYALPFANHPSDVLAIKGRIVRSKDRLEIPHRLDFGASKHISRVVLTAMRFDHRMRSAMNLKFSEDLVRRFRDNGFEVVEFRREDEPDGVSTMEWGTEMAITSLGQMPDIIFDRGSAGKEAMIRVLGKSPSDILAKVKRVLSC